MVAVSSLDFAQVDDSGAAEPSLWIVPPLPLETKSSASPARGSSSRSLDAATACSGIVEGTSIPTSEKANARSLAMVFSFAGVSLGMVGVASLIAVLVRLLLM